jgi:hypothetical protein
MYWGVFLEEGRMVRGANYRRRIGHPYARLQLHRISAWSLYWHKVADSADASGLKQGLAVVRAGAAILEKYSAT